MSVMTFAPGGPSLEEDLFPWGQEGDSLTLEEEENFEGKGKRSFWVRGAFGEKTLPGSELIVKRVINPSLRRSSRRSWQARCWG